MSRLVSTPDAAVTQHVIESIKHFRPYLWGRHFVIVNRSLRAAMAEYDEGVSERRS